MATLRWIIGVTTRSRIKTIMVVWVIFLTSPIIRPSSAIGQEGRPSQPPPANASAPGSQAALPPAWALADGSRVVFLGSTLIERDQHFPYLEFGLTTRWPDRNITFRNLAWSGDTVWGEARAGFDTAAEGYQRLLAITREAKPTHIVVCYGAVEAFAGTAGQARFRQGLEKLLDDLAPNKAETLIMAPTRMIALGAPFPDPAQYNANLASYLKILQDVAAARKMAYFDPYPQFPPQDSNAQEEVRTWTRNGQHWNDAGYRRWAATLLNAWGAMSKPIDLEWNARGEIAKAQGAKVALASAAPGLLKMSVRADALTWPAADGTPARRLTVKGLPPGRYSLKVGNQDILTANADAWERGVALDHDRMPERLRETDLMKTIRKKNELFFHRWRPQNITYLFGFRKHEQGQNAREIPEFDRLVAAEEAKIAKLRTPQEYLYELSLVPSRGE